MTTLFYQQLSEEEKALEKIIKDASETLDAVRLLKNRYKEYTPKMINTKETLPSSPKGLKRNLFANKKFPVKYDKGLNQYQKTYIVVHTLKTAFSNEIADKLHEIDPIEFPTEKAMKVAREKASDLYINGVFG